MNRLTVEVHMRIYRISIAGLGEEYVQAKRVHTAVLEGVSSLMRKYTENVQGPKSPEEPEQFNIVVDRVGTVKHPKRNPKWEVGDIAESPGGLVEIMAVGEDELNVSYLDLQPRVGDIICSLDGKYLGQLIKKCERDALGATVALRLTSG
jgi:hypothetical protein